MPSQRIRRFIVAGLAVCLGLVLWAKAGDLNPPAGPVAPTMKTLDQLSAEHAQIASSIAGIGGGGGGVNRVAHGCIELASGVFEATATLSPEINPSKSVVALSDAVIVNMTSSTNVYTGRNGACLMELTASSIKIRIDESGATGIRRVSYQIIEYN